MELDLAMSTPEPNKNEQSWKDLPAGHLPRATYFPAGLALATTLLFWSVISSGVIFLVGLMLFAVCLAGWIAEILHERAKQPKQAGGPERA